MEVLITKAQKDDIPHIFEIAANLNLSYWSRDDYECEIMFENSVFLVAKEAENHKVVGFLIARLIIKNGNDSYFSEIYNIGVSKNFHRKRVGKNLILKFLSECKKEDVAEVWLEVRSLNTVALEFYKRFGFRGQYTRKSFYTNPLDDALVLSCNLTET